MSANYRPAVDQRRPVKPHLHFPLQSRVGTGSGTGRSDGGRSLVALRQTQQASERGDERAVAVRVEDRVDGRVGVAQDDRRLDHGEVGAAGEQRDGVHDVQRQPAGGEHGQQNAENPGALRSTLGP